MKLLQLIVFIVILLSGFTAEALSDALHSFIEKFENFRESETARLRWTKSPDASENAARAVPIPNAVDAAKTHVPDPESGLWHYPNIGKVYDPKTGYYINYDAHRYYQYRTDTKAGKIYKGEAEVQIQRTEKVQK